MTYTTTSAPSLREADSCELAVILYPVAKGTRREVTDGLTECRGLCLRSGYQVAGEFADEGSRTTLERKSLKVALSFLLRANPRPTVLVIRDWRRISTVALQREQFSAMLKRVGVRIESVHGGAEPDVVWDSTDHTRRRVVTAKRAG